MDDLNKVSKYQDLNHRLEIVKHRGKLPLKKS